MGLWEPKNRNLVIRSVSAFHADDLPSARLAYTTLVSLPSELR
jgi:hypothetical protein